MITTSDAWKNLIKTEDLLPESDVNLVSNNDVQNTSNWGVIKSVAEDISDESVLLSTPTRINRKSSKIATLEWNFWVLDGTYEVPTEDTTASGYVSKEASNEEGKFETPVGIQLSSNESVLKRYMTVKFAPDVYEYATACTLEVGIEMSNNLFDEYDQYHYVYVPSGASDNYIFNIQKWSMPYRKVRINEFLLGSRLFFDKSKLSKFKHQRTGDMVNAELPQNDCSFSILDVEEDYFINSGKMFGNLIDSSTTFNLYYGFKIDNEWEYHLVDCFYLEKFERPANGIEASFDLESNLNRKTQTFSSSVDYSFTTYDGLISYIKNLIGVTITRKKGNFADIVKTSLSSAVKSNSDFYTTPMNEMLQMVACIINCYLYRSEVGLFELRGIYNKSTNSITDTTVLDTIPLENCFEYPEIENIGTIGNLTLTLMKYPSGRPDDKLDVNYVCEVGGQPATFPPQRFTKSYGGSVEQTAENSMIVYTYDTEVARQQNFTVTDGVHTAYMDWLEAFISGAKKVKANMRINPAWQIGDLIAIQVKNGSYIKGFIIDIDIEYAGYPKGNVTILSPTQLQGA